MLAIACVCDSKLQPTTPAHRAILALEMMHCVEKMAGPKRSTILTNSSLVLTDWCDVFVNNNVNTTNKVVWYAALPTTSQDCTRLLVSICMYSAFRACTLWGLVTMTFKLARPQNGGARCTFHEKPDHQIWTICLFVLELQALRCRRTDQRTAMEVTAW